MKTELEVRLGNDYSELPRLITSVDQFLQSHAVPGDVTYKAHLALEEMCTNVIKYGYDDEAAHEILVLLRWQPGLLTLRIEDDGHEFDPLASATPDLDKPLAERPIGGLGIHLVKKSVSTIRYVRENDRNILEMGLEYPPDNTAR